MSMVLVELGLEPGDFSFTSGKRTCPGKTIGNHLQLQFTMERTPPSMLDALEEPSSSNHPSFTPGARILIVSLAKSVPVRRMASRNPFHR